MTSRYITYGKGPIKFMRGSDRVERIYVAWEVLRMSPRYAVKHGQSGGLQFFIIERLIESRLSKGARHHKRGRPLEGIQRKFIEIEKTGTIYSLWHNYRKRLRWSGQCPDPVVARRLLEYLQFCVWAQEARREDRKHPGFLSRLPLHYSQEYVHNFVLGRRHVHPGIGKIIPRIPVIGSPPTLPRMLWAAYESGIAGSNYAKQFTEKCPAEWQLELNKGEAEKLLDLKLPPSFLKFIRHFLDALPIGTRTKPGPATGNYNKPGKVATQRQSEKIDKGRKR